MPKKNEEEQLRLPLPTKLITIENVTELTTPNLSLAYFKLADVYNDKWDLIKNKSKFLDRFVNHYKTKPYCDAFNIRKQFLDKIGIGFPLTTAKRLVFGVGYDHPIEIGFTFDWTTGLPIIPGSSLKGVARDTADMYKDELKKEFNIDTESKDSNGETLIDKIFGPKNSEHAGHIIFFPAYPCPKPNEQIFDIDVMTPHYQPYYTSPDTNPPADWYSPNPLHFLTVKERIKYEFRLALRTNLTSDLSKLTQKEKNLLEQAVVILKYALKEHGVGAKTRVDYGYFRDEND